MIKSFAQALPTYVMGVFKLPFSVCEDLTRMVRNYWWGAEQRKRKTHWMAWDKMVKAKSHGGIGFRDMRVFNQALLARQAWRLIDNPDSLFARVLKARYYPQGNIIDTVFIGKASSTWQAIAYRLELLKKGMIWRIGTGDKVRVWRDNWLPRDLHLQPITQQGRCRLRWVSVFLDEHGAWRTDLLQRWFLPVDVDTIKLIRPSPRADSDILAWHPETSGIFTVRSAYKLGMSFYAPEPNAGATSMRPDGSRSSWNFIWKAPVPQKVRIFAWKLATNCLATRRNKKERHLELMSTCLVCGNGEEDSFHTFCVCPPARALWEAMGDCWGIPPVQTVRNEGEEWLLILLAKVSEDQRTMMLMMLWRIWHVRNEITHDKPAPATFASQKFLQSYVDVLLSLKKNPAADPIKGKQVTGVHAIPRQKFRSNSTPEKVWEPPPEHWAKLNVDGSFTETGEAGAGMLLRGHDGQTIFSATRYLKSCGDALEVELSACMEGIALALQWTNLPLIVETDSSQVKLLLESNGEDRSRCRSLVLEFEETVSLREGDCDC